MSAVFGVVIVVDDVSVGVYTDAGDGVGVGVVFGVCVRAFIGAFC